MMISILMMTSVTFTWISLMKLLELVVVNNISSFTFGGPLFFVLYLLLLCDS